MPTLREEVARLRAELAALRAASLRASETAKQEETRT